MNKNNRGITQSPEKQLLNIAIIGGGKTCKSFLEFLRNKSLSFLDIRPVGVCDIDPEAEGLRLAKEMGIYTTDDFRNLFEIKDLDGVIELTNIRKVLLEVIRLKPEGLGVVEYSISRFFKNLYGS